ncbi:hypothetical protein [Schaalia sp. ZJ405]|nr:hypothetical protein [Schaalia sp. ZJ405]
MSLDLIKVLLSIPAAIIALVELADKVSRLVEKFGKHREAED